MQINQGSLITSSILKQRTEEETLPEMPVLEGIAQEVIDHLKNYFLSLIYFNTCRSLKTAEIMGWEISECKEILGDNNLAKVTKVVTQFRLRIFNQTMQTQASRNPSKHFSIHIQKVRLKGQEQCHFAGLKCTEYGYTGDDSEDYCILKNKGRHVIPNNKQAFGYQEISLDSLTHQLIYTLRLGPCIAILMVGVGKDGEAKKAALMHEDYSEPRNCVTDMYNQSFKDDLKNLSKIHVFLIGGNGGNQLTKARFKIHQSEISVLSEQSDGLLHLSLSTDDLDSPNDQFERDESNVFFSSMESSTYLWILQHNWVQMTSLKVTCVTGPEVSVEKLDAFYRGYILTQLTKLRN